MPTRMVEMFSLLGRNAFVIDLFVCYTLYYIMGRTIATAHIVHIIIQLFWSIFGKWLVLSRFFAVVVVVG